MAEAPSFEYVLALLTTKNEIAAKTSEALDAWVESLPPFVVSDIHSATDWRFINMKKQERELREQRESEAIEEEKKEGRRRK